MVRPGPQSCSGRASKRFFRAFFAWSLRSSKHGTTQQRYLHPPRCSALTAPCAGRLNQYACAKSASYSRAFASGAVQVRDAEQKTVKLHLSREQRTKVDLDAILKDADNVLLWEEESSTSDGKIQVHLTGPAGEVQSALGLVSRAVSTAGRNTARSGKPSSETQSFEDSPRRSSQRLANSGPLVRYGHFEGPNVKLDGESRSKNADSGQIIPNLTTKVDNASPSRSAGRGHNTDHLAEASRRLLRSVVRPVVIITSGEWPENSDTQHHETYAAITVSSFVSLTLYPEPWISFNMKRNSHLRSYIRKTKTFSVHILARNKHGADLAHDFSLKRSDDGCSRTRQRNAHGVSIAQDGQMIIHGPGVLARMQCQVEFDRAVRIGDHLLTIAKVSDVFRSSRSATDPSEGPVDGPLDDIGLSYVDGEYRSVSAVLRTNSNRAEHKDDVDEAESRPSLSERDDMTFNAESKISPAQKGAQFAEGSSGSGAQGRALSSPALYPLDKDKMEAYNAAENVLRGDQQDNDASNDQSVENDQEDDNGEVGPRPMHADNRFLSRDSAEANTSLDEILEGAMELERKNDSQAPSAGGKASKVRSYSTSALRSANHGIQRQCLAARRSYSTRSETASERDLPKAVPDSESGIHTHAADEALLKMTVNQYLGLDSIPRGRWINDMKIAELKQWGSERIQLAISGGRPDAPPGGQPGCRGNAMDMRIRKLIERLHRSNKAGHISDKIMEELILGPLEGGEIEERFRARREGRRPPRRTDAA